jgi:hypothetical protein
MKAKLLSIASALFFILLVAACKKETAGAKINLKFKDVNGTSFNRFSTITFRFDYTAKDTEADTLFIVRKFYTCPFFSKPDTFHFDFPAFEAKTKGTLEYSFVYSGGGQAFEGCFNGSTTRRTDSLNYYFWVKDKSGNISDTVVSPKIILLKD